MIAKALATESDLNFIAVKVCNSDVILCLFCIICADYSASIGERITAIRLSVCLSVCLRAYLWNRWIDLHKNFLQNPCGRGSVLL